MQGDYDFDEKFSRLSPLETIGETIKILSFKQKLQILLIVLAQVQAGNTSDSLLNKIRQIVYWSYLAKEITKNGNNNKIESTKI